METAAINGASLAYEEHGEGEPVVLPSRTACEFLRAVDGPAGPRRVPADPLPPPPLWRQRTHRGPRHHCRQAADLNGLLEHLGIERAHFAGHSYGV